MNAVGKLKLVLKAIFIPYSLQTSELNVTSS